MHALAEIAVPARTRSRAERAEASRPCALDHHDGRSHPPSNQAFLLSASRAIDVVEIVDRKNAATYQRVLAENGAAPAALTMVGDAFLENVAPVVRLGGRAVHVPAGRWVMLRPLVSLPTRRIRVCREIGEVPEAIEPAG